jgi:uncharacterized membrane protein
MAPQFLLVVLFGLSGLLLALVSLPLIASRIPRNHLYGFRTPKTLASDGVWYEANRYAGRQLFAAGATIVAGCLLLLMVAGRLPVEAIGLAGLALTLLPLGTAVLRSFRHLRRL